MEASQQAVTTSQLNALLHQNTSIQQSMEVLSKAHKQLIKKGTYNVPKLKNAMQVLVKKMDAMSQDIERYFL